MKIKPNDFKAWNNIGVSLDNLGKFDDAIACYVKAILINQYDFNAWYNIGISLGNQGKFDDAITCYDKAIGITPNDFGAWNNKGISLDDLGKFDDAITCYDKAIGFNPNYFNAWYNKGVSLDNLGKFDEAITCYVKAIGFKPDESLMTNMKNPNFKRIKIESPKEYNDRILSRTLSKNKTKTPGKLNKMKKLEEKKQHKKNKRIGNIKSTQSTMINEGLREINNLEKLNFYQVDPKMIQSNQISLYLDIIKQLENENSTYIPKSVEDGQVHLLNLLIKSEGIKKEAKSLKEALEILEYYYVKSELRERGFKENEIPKDLADARDTLENIRQNALKPYVDKIQKEIEKTKNKFDILKRKWDLT